MVVTENYTGADLSGNDGDANRVLTLANTNLTLSEGFQVFVDGLLQTLNTNYTVSHLDASSTVTFIGYTYDDTPITVNYNTRLSQTAPAQGALPLNARFIQKNIGALGDTCTVTEVAVTIGTDEYRTRSDVDTDHTNIPCYVHVLSYEDDIVKQGDARTGDLTFWFDASHESFFSPSGNDRVKITWNNSTYEVKNIMPFMAVGNTLMLIQVHVSQI